jgi:hypothetical protein
MGVSLVYLGKNDTDKEMHNMCKAIAKKLIQVNVQVQETNSDSQELPNPSSLTYDNVWFCGHSRFVEANRSVRKIGERNLGGFPVKDIAAFTKACVIRGKNKIRLICCESAQQQRYKPKSVGQPAEGLSRVLGNELLQTLNNLRFLDEFNSDVDARASHLEGLIVAMANLWREEKKAEQPAFEICGLWGAGDITDDTVPITSFLQDMGSLAAQGKMNDPDVKAPQQKKFTEVFNEAHCKNKGLPDFFGFRITRNFLVKWIPTRRT